MLNKLGFEPETRGQPSPGLMLSVTTQTKSRDRAWIIIALFINIRGQESEKVAGKNPNSHLTLSFQKQVYIPETWVLGRGKFLGGVQADMRFVLGGGAEREVRRFLQNWLPLFQCSLFICIRIPLFRDTLGLWQGTLSTLQLGRRHINCLLSDVFG